MNTDFLRKILDSTSVSGYEDESVSIFLDYAKAKGAIAYVDSMNNAYAILGPSDAEKTIMIEAHIDEIGFQVSYIDENGYIYLRRNGGVDESCLPGSIVEFVLSDGSKMKGVIGKKPVHFISKDENKFTPELDSLWVDTGLDPDIVKRQIKVGDPVGFAPNQLRLGKYKLSSKALDDKIGVFVLSECLDSLKGGNQSTRIVFVASSQEEVGCRGAKVSGSKISPDYAICIDVDSATDVPDCSKRKYGDIRLGNGVVISKHLDSNRYLSLAAIKLAEANHIPYQLSAHIRATGGNDAAVIQVSGENIKSLLLGIPCRYIHTPVEIVDMRDIQSAVSLIHELINQISSSE